LEFVERVKELEEHLLWSLVLKLPKEKASLKVGGNSKTEVRGLSIEIGETGLVRMFVVITAEAVAAKIIRFAGDEGSGGIESAEAVIFDQAIPSSSLSTLLLVVGS
jgi:hypothetical protein